MLVYHAHDHYYNDVTISSEQDTSRQFVLLTAKWLSGKTV